MFARGRYRRNLADPWRGSLLSAACKVSGCCTCKARRTKSPAADTWEFLRKLQVIRFYLVETLMIGIECERNWIVGASEFYDSPISSLCQKVSTSSRVFLMFWGPSLCWNFKATARDTVCVVRVFGAWRFWIEHDASGCQPGLSASALEGMVMAGLVTDNRKLGWKMAHWHNVQDNSRNTATNSHEDWLVEIKKKQQSHLSVYFQVTPQPIRNTVELYHFNCCVLRCRRGPVQ